MSSLPAARAPARPARAEPADRPPLRSLSRRASDPSAMLKRYAERRDPGDLDALVRRFTPLARKLALRYARAGEHAEDLEQVAYVGLVKALRGFDPARGFAFSSFAVPTILGELKRFLRDTSWAAHVPRGMQERVASVRAASDAWLAEHGRPPSTGELAGTLGLTDEEIGEALSARASLAPLALDAPAGGSDDEDGLTLQERLGDHDAGYGLVEDRQAVATVLPLLTATQREMLRLRFEHDMRQSEIAQLLGCSQMQVSRTLRSALDRLSYLVTRQSQP